MKSKFLIFSLLVVTAVVSTGCTESPKLPAPNDTKIATPEHTPEPAPEQKLFNETKPLINGTFETWSRGYGSNISYEHPYFRVITDYDTWIAFLNEQRTNPIALEGELFPGIGIMPRTLEPENFTGYFIIAAMIGRISATLPEIEIKNISRSDNAVNVTFKFFEPNIKLSAGSAPYHIVIVKRVILPEGNSTFVFMDTEGRKAGNVEVKV